MLERRDVLLGAMGVAAAAAVGSAASGTGSSSRSADTVFRFASSPDLFNADVGDVSHLPTWDGGRNSLNSSWERAVHTCLGAVARHRPDAFFVAGDLVEGRWNVDTANRRIFGRTSQEPTPEGVRLATNTIRYAGQTYYGQYRRYMLAHGLDLYAAVGDHEILDDRHGNLNDRWRPAGNFRTAPDNRYYLVDACKDVWADHFTRTEHGRPRFDNRPDGPLRDSAYAVSFANALTLITVDVFDKTPGGVRLGVFGEQLLWLRDQIREAKRHGHVVIVQGHIPIIKPYRVFASGNLHVPTGTRSAYYRALREFGADFLFCGEVHDTTVHQTRTGAPVQISHGCLFGGGFNYLIGDVSRDGTLTLDLYEVPQVLASRDRSLWQTDAKHNTQRTAITYGGPQHYGRLVYAGGKILERTMKLGVYDRHNDPWDYARHRGTIML